MQWPLYDFSLIHQKEIKTSWNIFTRKHLLRYTSLQTSEAICDGGEPQALRLSTIRRKGYDEPHSSSATLIRTVHVAGVTTRTPFRETIDRDAGRRGRGAIEQGGGVPVRIRPGVRVSTPLRGRNAVEFPRLIQERITIDPPAAEPAQTAVALSSRTGVRREV